LIVLRTLPKVLIAAHHLRTHLQSCNPCTDFSALHMSGSGSCLDLAVRPEGANQSAQDGASTTQSAGACPGGPSSPGIGPMMQPNGEGLLIF
jgi:hypothetical protein